MLVFTKTGICNQAETRVDTNLQALLNVRSEWLIKTLRTEIENFTPAKDGSSGHNKINCQ